MDFSKKNILVLTDGSAGMISQVEGLARQFNSNFKSMKTKIIFPWSKIQPGLLPIFSWIFLNDTKLLVPDIIISCGRKSVFFSIYLKRKYKNAINIHIQNPKTSLKKFSYIIAPEHDQISGDNVLKSIGALHKFNDDIFRKINKNDFRIPYQNLISIIIGGSNNHYRFSNKEAKDLSNKLKKIILSNTKYNFLILYSRRTTQIIKNIIKEKLNDISIIWEDKNSNPYSFALKYSDYFIVTSDSTSMISECAYTGNPIYIFTLPFKRKSQRFENFHNKFNKLNITKDLKNIDTLSSWNYDILDESKRIASIIKNKIITKNS